MIPFPYQHAGAGLIAPPAVGGATTDPYWANVVSLLDFEGADGSTSFNDLRGLLSWTRVTQSSQGPLIDDDQSLFGATSCRFPNAGCLRGGSTPLLNAGTGDFTYELDVYFVGNSRGYLFSLNGNDCAFIITPNTGLVEIYGPASWVINGGSTAFALNMWHRLCLEREGNIWRIYRGGTVYLMATDNRSWGSWSVPRIGDWSDNGRINPNCYMDQVRLTVGVARYKGAYTPSASPFPSG